MTSNQLTIDQELEKRLHEDKLLRNGLGQLAPWEKDSCPQCGHDFQDICPACGFTYVGGTV